MTNQTNNEKSKNGKRLALILVALLLIAAVAFGAFTYSRYITEKEGTGTAQVAAWGFEAEFTSPENSDMGFATDYNSAGPAAQGAGDLLVAAAGTKSRNNVVAPNTKGSTTFSLTGTAEVAAEVTFTVEETSQVYINISDGENVYKYTPIVFSYGETTNVSIEDINTALAPLNQKYAPNASVESATGTISWAWNYSYTAGSAALTLIKVSGSGAETIAITENDAEDNYGVSPVDILDTALGQLAAGKAVTKTTVTIGGKEYTIQTTTENTDYCLNEKIVITVMVAQLESRS